MTEQRPAEIVAETPAYKIDEISGYIGSLAMPDGPKQTYAYLEESGQLVWEPFSNNFDFEIVPVD